MIEQRRVPAAAPAICSSTSMPAMGPDPQLTPRASTPGLRGGPSRRRPPWCRRPRGGPRRSSARPRWAGRQARRAASTAASRWPRSLAVSIMTRSMPPSRRPSSCSLAARPASMSGRWLGPCRGELTGPIEPATSTSRPETSRASRASCAARRLRRAVRSASPSGARRTRLALKVSVSMMSAPAAMYSRWTAVMSSGRLSTSSSSEARCGTPRLKSSVPMAPSSSRGRAASRSAKERRACERVEALIRGPRVPRTVPAS